ncbi:hypothetical protein K8S17_01395, partial [bacterium]|nr:hypothetical protein [bacterium]
MHIAIRPALAVMLVAAPAGNASADVTAPTDSTAAVAPVNSPQLDDVIGGDWYALIELLQFLPDDVDQDTRDLVADLIAEVGGFGTAPRLKPGNSLRLEKPNPFSAAFLVRASGTAYGLEQDVGGTDWGGLVGGFFARLRAGLPGEVKLGLVAGRDSGEADALDHIGGCVHWSTASHRGEFSMVLGDMIAEWGQRLVVGAPSLGTRLTPASGDRVRGYDGAAENTARRGVSVSANTQNYRAQLFATRSRFDVGLDDEGGVTTLRTSGIHVTDGEREGKDALGESAVGLRVARRFEIAQQGSPADSAWWLGVTFVCAEYDRPFVRGDTERRRFRFTGTRFGALACDASGRVGLCRWGAEVAFCSSGERAALATFEFRSGGSRVLVGADAVSKGFWSPLGTSPPGAS